MIWVTDGSFEGCLTAIYDVFYAKDNRAQVVSLMHYKPNLIDLTQTVYTDPIKASKVAASIDQKLGRDCFQHVLYCFFSEVEGVETIILRFLRTAFKKGAIIIQHQAHEDVRPLLDHSQKTSREAHRFLGILRFMELESGIYYAPCEPTHYILPLLGSHFSKRLGEQPWVIHDVGRELGVYYDTHSWHINGFLNVETLKLHPREYFYQAGWQTYFRSIAIEARNNPNLQRNMMPKKYWKYLVEMQGQDS